MANLRSLIYAVNIPAATNYPQEFVVYNTSVNTPSNGGRCCLWTVPAGTKWISFEMWGGGGGGGGSCCCMAGRGGGSGAYTMVDIAADEGRTLGGCQYTICAGSSTGTSNTNDGCTGFTSFVTGYKLSNFCATGGANGCTRCGLQCYTDCVNNPYCCCAYGGDINIHGITGNYIAYTSCANSFQGEAMVAARTVTGPQYGPGGCINGGGCGCGWHPCSVFPGGGGMSAQSHGGSCWCGMWGAGGLVSITYA